VDPIHIAASLVLSSALPIAVRGFSRWCIQRQSHQSLLRLAQVKRGCTLMVLQDNGAIRIEWCPDNPPGVRPLRGVPPELLEQPTMVTRVDGSASTRKVLHDNAGPAPRPELKGRGRARQKHRRARRRR
jgi:hypothetical protein